MTQIIKNTQTMAARCFVLAAYRPSNEVISRLHTTLGKDITLIIPDQTNLDACKRACLGCDPTIIVGDNFPIMALRMYLGVPDVKCIPFDEVVGCAKKCIKDI